MFHGKRLLSGMLAACLLIVFAGCGDMGKSRDGQENRSDGILESAPAGTASDGSDSVGREEPDPDEDEIENKNEDENQNKDMEDMNAMDIVNNMRIGWNIGNTLDSTRTDLARIDQPFKFETAWGNPKVTQELIDAVLDAGFNVIRVPVSWTNHIAPAPDYTITPSWMERVKEVVDYAYNKGAYVIVNVHHEDWNYPYYENLERASAEMEAVWTQIAEVFQDYDEHLIFEGQNEPRKIGTPLEWNGGDAEGWEVVNQTNKVFINTVRASGGSNPYRMLMIPGYAANCTVGIRHVEVPENDDRIILSVHAYEPYEFALKPDGRSEWNQDTAAIDSLMNDLKIRFVDKGIPVIIGEFGAMNRENEPERSQWAEYYVGEAKKIGVPCIWWDNGLFQGEGERFGLFDRHTGACCYPELLEALMRGTEK